MNDFRSNPLLDPRLAGSVTSRTPTWRENLAGAISSLRGQDTRKGYQAAQRSINEFEALPFVGQAASGLLTGNEAYRAGAEGDYVKGGLLGLAALAPLPSTVKKPATSVMKNATKQLAEVDKVLTEKEFRKLYSQHIDFRSRGKDPEFIRDKIINDGWKSGVGVNTLPIFDPRDTGFMATKFGPKKGDMIYFAPADALRKTRSGLSIKEGWKPKPYETAIVEYDNQNPYELYRKSKESMMAGKNTP